MELEKEIKQKKFRSETHKAVINIIFTASWINSHNARLLKPYDISSQQFNILRILRGQHPNPVNIRLLQERMLDKMSNASRLVEKLKQKDYVDRTENLIDRRQADVVINEKGLVLLKKLDGEFDKAEGQYNLSGQEAKELNRLLDKMRTKV
ncbi:MAG: MarR family transcriptional regulator [Bacteroidota bacterium]|nr:MarR family transcriptional regulator [Bacteroidota bacterium]